MKHSLIESINKAYKLLENDDMEIIEEEPLEEVEYVEEEPIEEDEIEDEVEEEFPEEVEEKVNDLEARIEAIENELGINPEEVIDTEAEEEVEEKSLEEKFNDRIRRDFIFFSGLPEDTEITEELLDKRNCKQAYIPSVANRNKITSDEVRNSLLGR